MKILFISSMAIVTPDPAASRKLFMDTLGLPLKRHEGDDYYFSENIGGSKHFGVWPLSQAAEACFGTRDWPVHRPIPQACIEFEVEDLDSVATAAQELQEKGYALLHDARTEPWGQTVARLQTMEGAIVGISYAPWMHEAQAGLRESSQSNAVES
jgi:catechol 2,3-dioxygenase-like lactoylglutathione lyase family enzyme